jgi:hypothetical protein
MSSSAHTLCPPFSHGPVRCPSTRQLANNILPSTHIRHSTTCPVHQSHTKPQGTRRSTCNLFQWLRSCHTYPPRRDISWRARVGVHMRSLRLAAVVFDTGLQLVHPSGSHFHGGTALHLREWISPTTLARRHRGQPVARRFKFIHLCEGSVLIPKFRAAYRADPAGARLIGVLPALQCLFLDKLHPSGTVQEEM